MICWPTLSLSSLFGQQPEGFARQTPAPSSLIMRFSICKGSLCYWRAFFENNDDPARGQEDEDIEGLARDHAKALREDL